MLQLFSRLRIKDIVCKYKTVKGMLLLQSFLLLGFVICMVGAGIYYGPLRGILAICGWLFLYTIAGCLLWDLWFMSSVTKGFLSFGLRSILFFTLLFPVLDWVVIAQKGTPIHELTGERIIADVIPFIGTLLFFSWLMNKTSPRKI